ncbi:MAG: EscU/YscU/HrcU family type III secretion system export apparatus switch protein [Bdellovibrionales bacterium]|nr:EscU/YscU/HrcU family type III secretion system export apparatus switch protein [Bdellovibrionales bacterium]
MSSDSKQYPPSDTKLEKLRRDGIVPVSKDCTSAAVAGGVAVGLMLAVGTYGTVLRDWFRSALGESSAGDGVATVLRDRLMDVVELSAWLFFGVLIVVGISHLVQTRALLAPAALRWNVGTIFRWGGNVADSFRERAGEALGGALQALCWIGVVLLGLLYAFQRLAPGGKLAPQQERTALAEFLSRAGEVFFGGLAVGVGYLIFVALLSRFLVVLRFTREHSMTRAEVEAETREHEVRPEIRAARRERSSE